MSSKRSSRSSSEAAFTIIETVVSMSMAMVMGALMLSALKSSREVLGEDLVRTRLNQNLRGAMDVIGNDARLGGENLVSTFPAIQLADGASGAPDTLTLRRNQLDEVLPVCVTVSSGSSVTNIVFGNGTTTAGCPYSGQLQNFGKWRAYRQAQTGPVKAYIYNISTKLGEFFTYSNEVDTGSSYYIVRSSGTWANTYPAGASAIYLLEEWRFQHSGGYLQLIENADTSNPKNLAYDVTDFQVRVLMQDGTAKTSFAVTDNWTLAKGVEVRISGRDHYARQNIDKTVMGTFFPRNILSN